MYTLLAIPSHFPALLTLFPDIAFFIKGNTNNGRNPTSCIFPVIAIINEEATGCINKEAIDGINEAAIGAIIAPRNPPSCFFIPCFTVSVAPLIHTPDFSGESMILIMSVMSSFEMNKLSPFPAITAPCPLIFLSNLSNTDEVALVANLNKTF